MAEHKGDELTTTGTHRAWVGEASGPLARAGAPVRDLRRNWLERSQPSNPRHAAITRSLYSWNNYKSWTDKINKSWEKDKSGK